MLGRNADEQRPQSVFADSRQERIHRRLSLLGSGPATFYRDACSLMNRDHKLATVTHLVAHCFREIESALCSVCPAIVEKSPGDDRETNRIRRIGYGIGLPEPITEQWVRFTKDYPLHGHAHRRNLAEPRALDDDIIRHWKEFEGILDIALERLESRYLGIFDALDQLIAIENPTKENGDNLRKSCPQNPVALRHLFDTLRFPRWLPLLSARDFFSEPPQPERLPDDQGIQYPAWPQGNYLTRMASIIPREVKVVILTICHTANFRVHSAVAEAASQMPPEVASEVVPKLVSWLANADRIFDSQPPACLVAHLAKGREIQAALELTRALLGVDPITPSRLDSLFGRVPRDRDTSRMEHWEYREALKAVQPALAEYAQMEALTFLCELLHQAAFPQVLDTEGDAEDYEWTGPPAIEDHDQNCSHDAPRDLLVFAIRDTADSLIEDHGIGVLETIESFPQKVFKRIGLYLRRKWSDVDLPGTNAILSDPAFYKDSDVHHERYHLLKAVFGQLQLETQDVFFEHVKRGPDVEKFKEDIRRWGEKAPTEEEVDKFCRHCEFGRLLPVNEHLSGFWKERYVTLSNQCGTVDHPDFLNYIGSMEWAPESVLEGRDERAQMTVRELTNYLRERTVSSEREPTLGAFGVELAGFVQQNPEKYCKEADLFKGLPPEIIHKLLSPVRDLVRDGKGLQEELWEPVLKLCKWAVDQPRESEVREGPDGGLNSGWGRTRKEVADLLDVGLKSRQSAIPIGLRDLVWEILSPLTSDPDPAPERTRDDMPPADLAINCIRGRAMHAVIEYALWVRRYNDAQPDGKAKAQQGFVVMDEVRAVLDRHLDIDFEPSPAIRSVYGQWFPWLVLLDSEWAISAKDRIFSSAEEDRLLFDAAWQTYICFCRPYKNVFPILRNTYERAVQLIGTWTAKRYEFAKPDESLAVHLISFYWWELMDLDDPLLRSFYDKAPVDIRGEVLSFIGRSLKEDRGTTIDAGALSRVERFWEWRLKAAGAEADSNRDELVHFGSIFVSGMHPEPWSLDQLQRVLELVNWAEPDHMVVECLAKVPEDGLGQAVHCLELMVKGHTEYWQILGWRDHTRKLLERAIAAQDTATRKASIELTNRLGALGHTNFRDLLPKDWEQET